MSAESRHMLAALHERFLDMKLWNAARRAAPDFSVKRNQYGRTPVPLRQARRRNSDNARIPAVFGNQNRRVPFQVRIFAQIRFGVLDDRVLKLAPPLVFFV